MKKSQLLLSILLVPVDLIMLMVAALLTYYLRFSALVSLRPIIYEIHLGRYFFTTLIISFLWLPIFALASLYTNSNKREIIKIFFACTVGIMGIILFIFFQRELFSSRFIVLAAWLISIICVWLGRKILRFFWKEYLKKTKVSHRVFLVGKNGKLENFISAIKNSLEYSLTGYINDSQKINLDFFKKNKKSIDEIILIDSEVSKEEKMRLLSLADEENIPFRYLADPLDAKASHLSFEIFFSFPLITIKRTTLEGWGRIIKRIFDIIFSSLALIIFSPLILITSILIKIDSPGSVFVFLERVGRKGKNFKLIKFRSMIKDAHQLKDQLISLNERKGPLFKIKNDPRITKLGKFLRKTSIDEIPQFVNVLKGEMSIVGPRPHEPQEVERYEKYQKKLLFIKPGVTGLAQLYGRSNQPFFEEAKLDLYYSENWSFSKDIEIILKTIPIVIFRKGAV